MRAVPLGHLCLTHRIYFKHYFETLVNERGDAATEHRERDRDRESTGWQESAPIMLCCCLGNRQNGLQQPSALPPVSLSLCRTLAKCVQLLSSAVN